MFRDSGFRITSAIAVAILFPATGFPGAFETQINESWGDVEERGNGSVSRSNSDL